MIGTVPEVLARSHDLVAPAMRAAVDRLDPMIVPIVAYHLGWVDPEGRPVGGGGGKGIRPTLVVLSAEAAGAPATTGVPGAVAVELVHNFSLLHDDVMDEDRERRHRPSAWALFGIGPAIIAGDALMVLARQVLDEVPSAERHRAAMALDDATAAMIAGQAHDLAFESRLDVAVEECLAMSAGKTGALLACASSLGAILAGAPEPVVGALHRYGHHLGLAFQAVDDLLGIWGEPERTGKPVGADLRQHKKSLPITAALGSGSAAGRELAGLLAAGPLDDAATERATRLVEEAGGRDRTVAEADHHRDEALASLQQAELAPQAHRHLEELVRFVATREH